MDATPAEKGGNARLRAGDDDTASVSSTSTAFTAGLAEEDYYNDSEVDAFHACIDNTYENRWGALGEHCCEPREQWSKGLLASRALMTSTLTLLLANALVPS